MENQYIEPQEKENLPHIDASLLPLEKQLKLFELTETESKHERLSHTIELYDALPKYIWGPVKSGSSSEVIRTYVHRGEKITVSITPAQIVRDDKKVFIYPGQREEVIEDALRKLVAQGKGHEMGGEVAVKFSINELRKELAKHGRSYSATQIKEALYVCQGARITIESADNSTSITTNLFPVIALTSRKKYIADGDSLCIVRFHPLVTRSIIENTFRRYDYKKNISMKNNLARYIHKRISHYWTQASFKNTYSFNLITFLERSPRGLSEDMKSNIRAMKDALETLKKYEIILSYDEERLTKGRRVINITYTLTPHDTFIKDMKSFNFHSTSLLETDQNLEDNETEQRRQASTSKKTFISWVEAIDLALPGETHNELEKRLSKKGYKIVGGAKKEKNTQ